MKHEKLTIQGIQIDSLNEYYVAKALDTLGYQYTYQYEIFGGNNMRGGQVIDFLVHKPPRPIPLFVHGEYWHTGRHGADDDFKIAMLDSRMKGQFAPSVIIWEHECETFEAALTTVSIKIGV